MRHGVWKAFLLVGLLAGVFAMSTAQAAMPYMDPQGRFSFTIPDGYAQETMSPQAPAGVTVAIFSTQALPGARFTLTTVDDPANTQTTVDVLTAQTLQQLTQGINIPDIEVSTQGIFPLRVGSADAREYVFRGTVPGTTTKVRGAMVVALKGTVAYSILFTSLDGDFNTMADQCTPVLATFAFAGEQASGTGAIVLPAGPTATPKNIAGAG